MKNFALAAAAALFATQAFADGPGSPWDRPPVGHSGPSFSWDGAYGGVGITTRTKTDRTVTEVPDGHLKECIYGNGGSSSHSKHKCYVDEDDWNNSPELLALPVVQNPWNNASEDVVRYGRNGVWLGNHENLTFSSATADVGSYRGAPEYLSEAFKDLITLDEDEEITGNLFAGYRHVFTSSLAMGVEAGTVGGLEGQFGIANGRLFAYAGFNTDSEATLGADVLMGQGGWFLGGKLASGDDTRGEFRLGIKF